MDFFKSRIINEWVNLGYSFFNETIWSSSLGQVELPRIREFLVNNSIDNVDVSLVIPPHGDTARLRWSRHYQGSGQCVSLLRKDFIEAGSNNLKLTFCYQSQEKQKNSRSQETHVANVLRLIFGVPVARELLLYRSFSDNEDEPVLHSDEGFASFFDNQQLNLFDDPRIERGMIRNIPVEATILLDKAFSQTYPAERFVLMWLALEAVISSLPGAKSNGDKRKEFFNDVLNSAVINEEVFRLFRLRCDMFKEGKIFDASIEEACWSLYCVLQLAVLDDCVQRQAFLSGFEAQLLKVA